MKFKGNIILLISLFTTCFFIYGQNFKSMSYRENIKKGKEKNAEIYIKQRLGDLFINGTAKNILEFYSRTKDTSLHPDIKNNMSAKTNYINIVDKPIKKRSVNNLFKKSTWYFSINKKVRYSININKSFGSDTIDLSNCKLSEFKYSVTTGNIKINLRNSDIKIISITTNSGESEINLSDNYNNNIDANIYNYFGKARIILPKYSKITVITNQIYENYFIPDFIKIGNKYVYDPVGKAKNNIIIKFKGIIGKTEFLLQ